MNAGSFGSTISDNLISVTFIDSSGIIKEIPKTSLFFDHRLSSFSTTNRVLILGAHFSLSSSSHHILLSSKHYQKVRQSTQERRYPNLGSIFATNNLYRDEIRSINGKYLLKFILKLSLRLQYSRFIPSFMRASIFIIRKYCFCHLIGFKDFKYFKSMTSVLTENCLINKSNFSSSELIAFLNYYDSLTVSRMEIIINDSSSNGFDFQ